VEEKRKEEKKKLIFLFFFCPSLIETAFENATIIKEESSLNKQILIIYGPAV
jgi:hypothetical protein